MAERTVASRPCFMRGAHAARSSILGAPLAPVPWQLMHLPLTICSPLRSGWATALPAASAAQARARINVFVMFASLRRVGWDQHRAPGRLTFDLRQLRAF